MSKIVDVNNGEELKNEELEKDFDLKWYDHAILFVKGHWKTMAFAAAALALGSIGVKVYNSRKDGEGFMRDTEDDLNGYTVYQDGDDIKETF